MDVSFIQLSNIKQLLPRSHVDDTSGRERRLGSNNNLLRLPFLIYCKRTRRPQKTEACFCHGIIRSYPSYIFITNFDQRSKLGEGEGAGLRVREELFIYIYVQRYISFSKNQKLILQSLPVFISQRSIAIAATFSCFDVQTSRYHVERTFSRVVFMKSRSILKTTFSRENSKVT